MRRICSIALLMGTSAVASLGCGNSSGTGFNASGSNSHLRGAGSSFIDPMMQEWATDYFQDTRVKVIFEPTGSSAGIDMMMRKEVDFACTEAPMTDAELARARERGGEVIHIPLLMGGIVPAYNLKGKPDLVFSGEVIGKIYLGKITKWNDPAIKALNPMVDLPNLDIVPVRRLDGSGSTYVLTDYLRKVLGDKWTPGVGATIEWPVGKGETGNDGVAGFIKDTDGAFGYVELVYALKSKIPYGAVKNSRGKAIKADLQSVKAAGATAEHVPDLRHSITNAPGEDAYPISGIAWAVLYVNQPKDKAKPLKDFLTRITHVSQKGVSKLQYTPLPETLVKKVEEKLALIRSEK
jgi:phosphate transport system substrate-binding protein